MGIKPEYLTLDDLLQKRLFRIPNYQRAYSWETKQRSDLFDDIKKLYGQSKDRHHFMSTIVCLKTDAAEEIGTDEYRYLDIVDGQQRLTTLVILLKALSKQLANGSDAEKEESAKLDKLLVKGDNRLILLQTNHSSSIIFRDYLESGQIANLTNVGTLAENNMIYAFRECEGFIKTWTESHDLLSLLKLLKNRLDFIFYVLEDEGSVYTVFEVLNSRGLAVDWLDKCKSTLMGLAFEKFDRQTASDHINELHTYWAEIYATIGIREVPGSEILRFAATLWHSDQQSKPLQAEKSIEIFRDLCCTEPNKIIDVSKWLLQVAKALESLYKNHRIKAVTDISQARLLAVAIKLSTKLSENERDLVLEQWERTTFRIFGLFRKDSRTKVGEYTRLAYDIINNNHGKDEILAGLFSIGSDHPVDSAVKQLKFTDCYNGWEHDLRYFLYRYEEYLVKQQNSQINKDLWEQIWHNSPSTTIEHIHPQTVSLPWEGKLGRVTQIEKHVNRLGNLLILPPNINSKAQNKGFKDKKAIYKQNYLRMMDEIFNKHDWSRKAIEEREEKLLEWAKNEWADVTG